MILWFYPHSSRYNMIVYITSTTIRINQQMIAWIYFSAAAYLIRDTTHTTHKRKRRKHIAQQYANKHPLSSTRAPDKSNLLSNETKEFKNTTQINMPGEYKNSINTKFQELFAGSAECLNQHNVWLMITDTTTSFVLLNKQKLACEWSIFSSIYLLSYAKVPINSIFVT